MKRTVIKKEIDFAVVSATRVPFCMLDLSPSPPGGLSLFSTFQKERPATNKSVADPGEGTGGPAPPDVWTKLRPQGPKKFF